ncbi:hypothetical protein KP509_38G055800 [Ceratopteris richardii]|uniref:Chromatin modification-related protein MEAF6 n=1 Tax=Ceratopteris richardii TaxID=49495 RepID=A0A8T2Q556_CERRI|nr:hypothetical protein KP509_38G055800 [Ceratopteris richardii]
MCIRDARLMSGQRDASTPQATLASLLAKREKLQEELRQVEKQVYDLETSYLQDSSQVGNVLKGFEGFLASAKGASSLKRPKKFQPEDRLFSLSSVTSPAVEENTLGRESDGRMDGFGQNRRLAGLQSNGPKPKRGRTQYRDAKRIKHASELDYDDDDDIDRISR